ncbi:P-loop NTPase family protein [Geitlerinema sp. PCC 9228]|jgi:cob(I)alamin adenosyltransferase|uniref:P-loop NTPase family protein n=1 Tax=Geitlerinema sp. PCC 9228 TaxID=111611 RepID=UPI0008F9C429|nr:P-loop NTPase family protein [Geitlerinema sp. PCC 9228]
MVAQVDTSVQTSRLAFPYQVEGTLQIFTSPRRGFFTNVIAQAFRIAGQGTSVLIVQFLKGGIRQGHQNPMKFGEYLDWLRCDLMRTIETPDLEAVEIDSLKQLWQHTQEVVLAGKYDFVVLDELSLATNLGLIAESEVLDFLNQRPHHIDVVLTGTEMPESVLDMADQITEIRRSKRP